jgi:hypothetical protein
MIGPRPQTARGINGQSASVFRDCRAHMTRGTWGLPHMTEVNVEELHQPTARPRWRHVDSEGASSVQIGHNDWATALNVSDSTSGPGWGHITITAITPRH